MPQKTNLNIDPYYDDFNVDKNFYRVLFKPGFPIQARELTTLQSILQNQVELFGSHIFKEGSMVIPGSISYDDSYFSVKIYPDNLGIDVTLYLKELVGKRILGQTSGVEAVVQGYSVPPNDNVEDIVLYVRYLSSGTNFESSQFQDSEFLVVLENLTYGNTTINSGNVVAGILNMDATARGSAVKINRGVYFLRGSFVNIEESTIVLDPFSNNISYRVGLSVYEELVTSNEDSSLNDNAKGFNNYASPGADRLKIRTELSKKDLTDFLDTNFIELIRIENGQLKKLQDKSVYSTIRDYFAQRTYDESGNYSVKSFGVDVLNSLNDRISSDGIYFSDQKTSQGNTPSDKLACVKISPGKAYVRGYDLEFPGATIIDVEKPRDTLKVNGSLIPFEMGNLLRVNNVVGTPLLGINSSNIVELYNRRRNSTSSGTGSLIGKARVYSFSVSDAPYLSSSTEWDLYLFDIQTYTNLTLNENLSSSQCPASSYIKGKSSGASGYVVSDASSNIITLSQTSGTFISGEELIINGINLYSRSILSIKSYTVDDIKSIYQNSTDNLLATDFVADAVLYRALPYGFNITDKITINSSGIATCPGKSFIGIRSDAIIRYQKSSGSSGTYNRVVSISSDGFTMQLAAVTPSVTGICDGTLPSSDVTTTFNVGVPNIKNLDKSSLYTPLNAKNISSVDFSGSDLTLTTQITNLTTNSNGRLVVDISQTGISSAFFQTYDAERYSIFYSDSTIEPLSSDQVTIQSNASQVAFTGLRTNQTSVTVNATLRKNNIKNKSKVYVRSERLIVNKTSNWGSANISGLTTSKYYGLRVEDAEISLNVPDVANVLAVYAGLSTSMPELDALTFNVGLNLDTTSIIGEKITGDKSGAIGQLVGRVSPTTVEFVYLNSEKFISGENVVFGESNIQSNIQSIKNGSYLNIKNNYILDKGHKNQYLDYSKLVRTKSSTIPSTQLLIIFDYYSIPNNDTGDVVTVNSYGEERYSKDIPTLDGMIRATDTLDFRPRLQKFTSTTSSPFNFGSKTFETSSIVITPNESSIIGYSYYLPRIDKVVLNKMGEFSVIKGSSSPEPKSPLNVEEAMDIATIFYPAYLYNPSDIKITTVDNSRYTMRDIGKLESRISNLEVVTSLSLLELDTKTLQIQDADGLSRFKTGFFADDFKDNTLLNKINPDVKCDIDILNKNLICPVDFWSLKARLAFSSDINENTNDTSQDLPLLDPNVKKTGDLITLNYKEVGWIEQPFASEVENVNPFNMIIYSGEVKLHPSSDNWFRNIYLDSSRTDLNQLNSFTDTNTSNSSTTSTSISNFNTSTATNVTQERRSQTQLATITNTTRTSTADVTDRTTNTATTTSTTSYNGGREFDYVESVRVNGETDPYFRSRNVEFRSSSLRPLTEHYAFIDGASYTDIIPKLIEINMSSGAFLVGEDVTISSGGTRLGTFRTAQANHKTGTYNSPQTVYKINPYSRETSLPSSYSSSSTVINVDTFSFSEESITRYGGRIVINATLSGKSSGAIATVSNIRMITDNYGDLIGCFFIRDPNTNPTPTIRLKSGEVSFKLTSSSSNTTVPGSALLASEGSAMYSGSGIIQTQTTKTVSVRNPPIPPTTTTVSTNVSVSSNTTTQTIGQQSTTTTELRRVDPLAQSFTVDETGAFLTSVDVFFRTKDSNEKLTVQIRPVELGTPTNRLVQDYAQVVLEPDNIKVSEDASVPTNIKFPSPIYLQPDMEYALVLVAPTSNNYEVWIGTMGQKTINTQDFPDVESVIISKQYVGGSLFKSQNGTIWTANQFQDMKFKLYKANFTSTSGDVVFYNPPIRATETATISDLPPNPIKTYPRKLKVGITTSYNMNSVLTIGKKVGDNSSNAFGYIENVGGSIIYGDASAISIASSGAGYPSSGSSSNVTLYSITGSGNGATADVSFNSVGNLNAVSIANTGHGYAIGDVLGITTSDVTKGFGAKISISKMNTIDTLYLTGVQGEEFITDQSLCIYQNGSKVAMANTSIREPSSLISSLYSGNVIQVKQYNHGMHSANNIVQIKNIQPDSFGTIVASDILISDTQISVANTSNFTIFEGVTGSTGYLIIENEIMSYADIGVGNITISARGLDGSQVTTHPAGSICYKYELNGVSLTRINATYDDTLTSEMNSLKDIDTHYLLVDRGLRSSGDNQVSFTDERNSGGFTASSSQNYQYNSLIPQFNIITPGKGTTVSSQIRTTSGTSAGGSEVSFIDQGYEPIQLNKANFYNTTRLICSEINEVDRLSNNPSLTLRVRMNSSDKNLSPVLDLQTGFFVLGRNRVNNPISDYVFDSRSNLIVGDPHNHIYMSKKINLKQPATSLKVLTSAYRGASSDFRVLYQLFKSDSTEISQSFNLFPGYDNLKDTNGDGFGDTIIDPSANSGRSDSYVRPSNDGEFLEYQFSVDNLEPFTSYIIKIVFSSTDESYPVKLKDLRTIALA